MSSITSQAVDLAKKPRSLENDEIESGYVSASSSPEASTASLHQIVLTKPHLRFINQQMESMTALERLRFCIRLFPNLYQSTAFGLTGLVTIDMLSKLASEDSSLPPVEAIFLDTLYHFNETYELVSRVQAKYPSVRLHVYKPDGTASAAEFEAQYGEGLYDTAPELYDWVAKVEPQQRAYSDLGVAAVFTGRRRSQGGERDRIGFVEVDDETGLIKINPLLDWTFPQVRSYISEHNVPYNELLDRGYKSVGDWHSTSPVGEGEDERAGRWKGQQKTECGIHNKKSRYAQFLQQEQLKAKKDSEDLSAKLQQVEADRERAARSVPVS
ncbi:phosphoadenosine phosphosulfate reductase [Poronia punctata]|nr:phosphoadenosine phosphosulfate reductase [Poronia punctata]